MQVARETQGAVSQPMSNVGAKSGRWKVSKHTEQEADRVAQKGLHQVARNWRKILPCASHLAQTWERMRLHPACAEQFELNGGARIERRWKRGSIERKIALGGKRLEHLFRSNNGSSAWRPGVQTPQRCDLRLHGKKRDEATDSDNDTVCKREG